jgi:signal transduction histidine kinase
MAFLTLLAVVGLLAFAFRPQSAADPGIKVYSAELNGLAGRRQVKLPNILRDSDFLSEGSIVRYRTEVHLSESPTRPVAVYVSKLSLSGSLFVNGSFVGSCAPRRLEDARCLHQAVTFVVPAQLWHAGKNRLEFEVFASARQANGLSMIRVGDAQQIQGAFAWRHWVQYDLLIGLTWLSAAIGLLSLGVGLILRREAAYLWFGLTSIAHALASVNEFVTSPPVPGALYSWFIFSSRLVPVPMLLLAVLAIFERSKAWITRSCIGFILIAPIVIWSTGNDRMVVGWLYVPWLLVTPITVACAIRWSLQSRLPLHWQISGLLSALFAAGFIDWLKTVSNTNFETNHLIPYAYGATLVLMGTSLIRVLASALDESVSRTIALEKQVSERLAYEVTQNIPIGTFSVILSKGEDTPRFSFTSQRYLELAGFEHNLRGEPLSRSFDIVHHDDKEKWARVHGEAIARKQPIAARARIIVGDRPRWIAVEAKPRQQFDGSTIWDGILMDETEAVLAGEAAERDRAALQANLVRQSRLQEREELLRDMHDGFGSQLASVRMLAEKGQITPREVSGLLEEVSADLHLVVDTLGHHELTLEDALADMRYRLSSRLAFAPTRLDWDIQLSGIPTLLPRPVLHILRIIQEALNNALKHADAKVIAICASYDKAGNRLRVCIRDDGKGFPQEARPGRGVRNMHYRAKGIGGSLRVSAAQPGTVITFDLDLNSPELTKSDD